MLKYSLLAFCVFMTCLTGSMSAFAQSSDTTKAEAVGQRYAFVRGIIRAYENTSRKEIRLTVREAQSMEEQNFVLSPDTVSGRYFMLLQPGNKYFISVEAKEYKPYVYAVHIPRETFLYELDYNVKFEPIMVLDKRVGQKSIATDFNEHIVKSFERPADSLEAIRFDFLHEFMDMTVFGPEGSPMSEDPATFAFLDRMNSPLAEAEQKQASGTDRERNYDELFNVVQTVFDKEDISLINKRILIDENENEKNESIYFSSKETSSGGATIRSSNGIEVIVRHSISFSNKNHKFNQKQKQDLEALSKLVREDDNLYVEILGYINPVKPDSISLTKQLRLSAKRTRKVFRFLKKNEVGSKKFRMVAFGFGKPFHIKDDLPKNAGADYLPSSLSPGQEDAKDSAESDAAANEPFESGRVEVVICKYK